MFALRADSPLPSALRIKKKTTFFPASAKVCGVGAFFSCVKVRGQANIKSGSLPDVPSNIGIYVLHNPQMALLAVIKSLALCASKIQLPVVIQSGVLLHQGFQRFACVCVCPRGYKRVYFACVRAPACPIRSVHSRQGFSVISDALGLIAY